MAVAALLCVAVGAIAGARVPASHPLPLAPPVEGAPAPADLAARILALHNQERLRLGIRPLDWSDSLAVDARQWAEIMAHGNFFAHSSDTARHDEGENLFRGTAGAYSIDEMIGDFIDERADYQPGTFPDVARDGAWENVGHYTQLIWPGTRQVGCAIARASEWEYLACRYAPAGNVIGVRMN